LTWWHILPHKSTPRSTPQKERGQPATDHIGIDVHKRENQIYILAQGGEIIHRGRGKTKRVGTGKEGREAAKTAAEKIQAKLALGDTALLEDARVKAGTFAEFTEGWLKHVEAQCKPGTAEKYEMILRKHWLPRLGRLPLTGVTRDHIKSMLGDKLNAGLKAKTVRGHLDVLRVCLSVAVEDELIPANPAGRLGKFTGSSLETREIETFTRAELTMLLESAEREMPDAYPIVLTLARAGLGSEKRSPSRRTTWISSGTSSGCGGRGQPEEASGRPPDQCPEEQPVPPRRHERAAEPCAPGGS
jgi:hypothetical protein